MERIQLHMDTKRLIKAKYVLEYFQAIVAENGPEIALTAPAYNVTARETAIKNNIERLESIVQTSEESVKQWESAVENCKAALASFMEKN